MVTEMYEVDEVRAYEPRIGRFAACRTRIRVKSDRERAHFDDLASPGSSRGSNLVKFVHGRVHGPLDRGTYGPQNLGGKPGCPEHGDQRCGQDEPDQQAAPEGHDRNA